MWKLLEIEGFLDLFGRFDCRFGMSFPAIIIAPFLSVLHGQLFQHLSHQALVLSLLQRLSDLNTARRRREGGRGGQRLVINPCVPKYQQWLWIVNGLYG